MQRAALMMLPMMLLLAPMVSAQTKVPTVEEIQQALDAKQYPDVVKKTTQLLNMKGTAAAGLDRAKLFHMKGEALLQQKSTYVSAADAFASAAKEGGDSDQASADKALAALIKKSPGGKYLPKQPTTRPVPANAATGRADGIDVIDETSRKDAFTALFNDETKATQAKLASLAKQQSLVPVVDGLKQVGELRAIELAGTGKTETSDKMVSGLATHANDLITKAMAAMSQNVEKIATVANETQTTYQDSQFGTRDPVVHKRGLTSTDGNQLKEVMATCVKIVDACDELTKAMGTGGAGFAASKTQAMTLGTRAEAVLKADYDPQMVSPTGRPIPNQPARGGNRGSTYPPR